MCAYLFVFILGFSLKTLEVTIRLYNELKTFLILRPKISFSKRAIEMCEEEILLKENIDSFSFGRWRVLIDNSFR